MTVVSYKYMKFIRQNSLALSAASIALALVCFYQISPFTFKQYTVICTSNYGQPDQFAKCMSPYTSQFGIDRGLMVCFIALGIVFGGLFLSNKLSKSK